MEIGLLGPFEVLLGGRPAKIGGGKRRGLLAVLALARGRVVGVDELIGALWADDLPASPRNGLQHHVARLRAALGQESIVATRGGYALRGASVDADRFEALLEGGRRALCEGDARSAADHVQRALALWRGQPLQGLTDTEWFATEAARLEGLRVDALEARFEAALALGEHRELVAGLRAAVAENPFRERLWGQLLLALYRSGRQADALEAFQEARGVLAEELGLEPGPELRRLQEAILRQDPAIAPVPVGSRRLGNLPAPVTSFVDRERECADVHRLLAGHRLVTLTGPPGVGKSRLALEVVRSLESHLDDGAWLVELARGASDAGVAGLLADAVGARGPDPLARAIAVLRGGGAVLVLDACEHALADAACVAAALLRECPRLRLLATSREALRVPGEVRVAVAPLPVTELGTIEGADSPALQLFAARARAARGGFELTAEGRPIAAAIARRLDGLPLAIELAAARVNVLGLAELQSIVERRLGLLAEQPPADPLRTALQGLVEWSYDVLHGDEKTLLHQIAVHRGGASLPSLVAAGAARGLDEATVAYLLGALVDKSIVSVSFPREEARYDLLDTVRDYALARLTEGGGLAGARRTHAGYFATLAEQARSGLRGPDWRAWIERLELDHENLWAALTYARIAYRGDSEGDDVATRLGGSLGWYFSLAERVSQGRHFLRTALGQATEDTPIALRIELLGWLSFLATEELDLDAAMEAGERALALAASGSAPPEAALARVLVSLACAHSGDQERAEALADEAVARYRTTGDAWGLALSTLVRAGIAAGAGDDVTVAAMTVDGRRYAEAIPYEALMPPTVLFEAWVAKRRGDRQAAAEAYARAFDVSRRAGFRDHASFALSELGSIALADGDPRRAEELIRRALAAAGPDITSWPVAHAYVRLAAVRAAMGDATAAETLYRNVIEWAERPRPHQSRETQFIALAGNPAPAALLGLAELADARGDADRAGDLRERAKIAFA